MPPEPIPWDRKEFFKERKHERSESLGSAARWRRDSSYHHGSRDFNRWGSADFRRPAGHGKQGGWHLLPEESGRGYSHSRSCDKMLDDDNCRPVVSRDGKYNRSSKENRGSFGQRDWRERSWETSNGSQNLSTRQLDANNDQRSAVDMLTYSSRPHADFVNTWEQHHLKNQHDKMGGLNGSGTGQRCDKESALGSIDWKPLKWTRSGSLSSRGSGFSHSGSTRSFRVADSYEGKAELPHKNAAAIESHSGEAAACVTYSVPSEDTDLRKKPRLKWGEGLAKFEKKKVEGPDESSSQDDPILSISNLEPCNALCPSVVDKSPKVIGFSGCASPATPSSVACSSSPGVDDKLFVKAANVDNDVGNISGSFGPGSRDKLQNFSFNLEKLDTESLTSLGSSLNELLRFDDLSSVDSSLVRSTSTAMNKLLIWKADISKVLEVTETEIDSLENELKSLKSESEGRFPCPAASGSLLVCYNAKPCEGHVGGTDKVARPKPVQIVSSVDPIMEKMPFPTNLHTIHDNGKEEDIESPGTATSKFIEPPSLINAVSLCDVGRNDTRAGDLDRVQSTDMQCLVPCSQRQVASVCARGDVSTMGSGMDANNGASLSSVTGDIKYNTILSSNKECANRACEVFAKLLPKQCGKIGNIEASSTSHDSSFMERFTAKKQFARFKERVITLKFKALHHLWKEDMCILSIRKYRPKSHKKVELGVRTVSSGQKNRSSIRSRFPLPGNHLSLVPKSEIINFASKLLSESEVKVHRNSLKMPSLILDQKEKMVSKFISRNGLVEDPLAIEKERTMINPWTSEETYIFQEKFANFGKDFRKIATFLEHKTTADCVEFYYKNHKSDCFEKIKKQYGGKLGNSFSVKTNLMTSDKRWNCEVNAASLDILSAASEMADSIPVNQKLRSGSLLLRGLGRVKSSRGKDNITERSSGFDILHDERVSVAADVLAGICGSLSSEAISSCTSLIDHVEGNRNMKCLRLSPLCQQPEIPDVAQDIDDGIFSDEGSEEMDLTDWTDEEKALFLQAVSSFGKDYAMIAQYVGTRSQSQCKVFFSKARKCLGLDLMPCRPENLESPLNDHANGGVSDTDDACVVETGSANGSDKSGTKTDDELHSSVMNTYCDLSCHVEARNMSTDLNESKIVNAAEVHLEHVNMVSGAFIIKGKTKLTNDGNGIVLYSSDASGSVMGQKAINMSDSTEVGKDKKEVEGVVSELASATEVSSIGHENELEGRRVSSPQCLVEGDDKHEADTDALACSRLSFDVESQPQLSMEKPHISGLSVESPHAATNSLLQNATTAARCEKIASQDQLSSTCDFQGSEDNYCHTSISNVDHQLHNPGGLVDHVEAASTCQCYPLQVPVNKEVNVDTSCSGSSKKLPLLTQKIEQADDHCKTKLQCLSVSEKTSRNGDVKLFGKILTIPSSTQKPNLTTKGSEENDTHYPMLSSNSSNVKFTGNHAADGKSTVLNFDHNDHTGGGLENVPVMSYGYWDGNRIQTGFSSLPDSAILLAKYPAALSNYPEASAKSEQQSLKASAKNNEQQLNGAVSTRKVNGNNSVIDYEMCQNSDSPIVKPFMVDVKLHQDVFSEIQKRNGFEAISSLPQQGRVMVGINGVSELGTPVDGGVSDPVAAIKMHYSNSSGQSGSITREDESWGGKGETGSSSRCSV
ncbi:putative transcription factor MYB/SANT family [Lupinus albus]|uniref:Putative transcription factor MYB/SANT family n=1 Tax=Lupinus albus TaxID=3870 RepID=A0A6A4QV39_LUPAL|nr:putative transcription factor MYB/SANT family [Lupinus albus]